MRLLFVSNLAFSTVQPDLRMRWKISIDQRALYHWMRCLAWRRFVVLTFVRRIQDKGFTPSGGSVSLTAITYNLSDLSFFPWGLSFGHGNVALPKEILIVASRAALPGCLGIVNDSVPATTRLLINCSSFSPSSVIRSCLARTRNFAFTFVASEKRS